MFGVPLSGGMNQCGLFWFPVSVDNVSMNNMKARSLYPGDFIFDDLLAHCAIVKEAIAFLSPSDLSNDLEGIHLMLVDRSGDDAVIEGDETVTKDKSFYVLENISVFKLPEKPILCRYRMAYDLLEKSDLTIDAFRHILSVTCQGTGSACPTQFSAIFDLTKLTITIYHFQNYDETVKIDLTRELKKKNRMVKLTELFSPKWSFFNERKKTRISEVFYQQLKEQNLESAVDYYKTLKQNAQHRYEFDPWDLDLIGFFCMFNHRLAEALTIFVMNVHEYPDYTYGYFNLGRIYHKLGENKKAIAALQKSLELDSTRSVTQKYLYYVVDSTKN